MAKEFNFLSDERIQKIRESKIKSALGGIREKLGDLDIQVEQTVNEQPKIEATPRYGKLDLADHARKVYKENVKPVSDYNEPKFEDEDKVTANLPSIQYNARALARSLTGLRNSGNVGPGSVPAGPNGGNVGVGPASVAVMSVEEYEEHINKLFLQEEEVEETQTEPELLVEGDGPVEQLEERLLEMKSHTWQAIDLEMRRIAKEHAMTPKQLHKDFKAKHGMIPDDWAKEQEVVEQVGWMPLDEMVRINQHGQVFEVSFLFRGGRQRLKFFWPEVGYPSHQDMEEACRKFWPGARLLAYYPEHEPSSTSAMVIVPPMKENYELLPDDTWEFMSEEDTEIYDEIAAEEGEPITPVYLTEDEDAFVMDIEDHDTGEVRTVVFGEGKRGLWDNIHAKRKRGEKPAKPGDKNYPKTLNVEATGDVTGHGSRLDTAYHYDMEDAGVKTGDIKNRRIKSGKKQKFRTEDLEQARKNVGASTCWDGYKAKGTKKKGGKTVPNCVKENKNEPGSNPNEAVHPKVEEKYKSVIAKQEARNEKAQEKAQKKEAKSQKTYYKEDMSGMSQKSGDKRSTESGAGMTAKGVAKYNRRTGGNLKTAVTTPPSKLKPGSKAANRRKSFCARSRGWNGERGKAARRRWNC